MPRAITKPDGLTDAQRMTLYRLRDGAVRYVRPSTRRTFAALARTGLAKERARSGYVITPKGLDWLRDRGWLL